MSSSVARKRGKDIKWQYAGHSCSSFRELLPVKCVRRGNAEQAKQENARNGRAVAPWWSMCVGAAWRIALEGGNCPNGDLYIRVVQILSSSLDFCLSPIHIKSGGLCTNYLLRDLYLTTSRRGRSNSIVKRMHTHQCVETWPE